MPATADSLRDRLREILEELDARFPTVNEAYDPSQPTTAGETRQRSGRDDGAGGTERRRRGSSNGGARGRRGGA